MLIVIRKIIREVSKRAHLWPPKLRGRRICWVKRLINQFWSVKSRLLIQRGEGVGKRIHGRARASAISGIPSSVGLIN